jgi:alpha-tubulin suppressor-like RCC1 family protein
LNGSATVTLAVNSAYTESGAFSGPTALAAGQYHSLALRSDGTVAAWGDNTYGQTTPPAGLSNVVAIAARSFHNLALRGDGTVVAWGDQTTIPAGLSNVVAIAAGGSHSLALSSDGTIAAWGDNTYGQTIIPAGLSNVVALAAGTYHNLALRSDGTVIGWGYNAYGQTTIPAGLNNVVAIAAGDYFSLALRGDGTVVGWGDNRSGQLYSLPADLSNVVALAAGYSHSLALRNDGTVTGWGPNYYGQLTIPDGLDNVVAIACGSFYHSLALRSDGTVFAWGSNSYGQTTIPANVYLPATVSGSVDTTRPGNYVLTYSVTNPLGGSSTTTTRTVAVPATLTYTAGANGSLDGTTPQTVNYGASGTAVTAVPDANHHFVNWSDGSTANPRTDTSVTNDLSVTANFATGGYTLTYAAGANGLLSGTTPQTVNHGDSGTAVTAVPDAGYHFVNWSDDSTANPRTDTGVTANKSVTANFLVDAPVVDVLFPNTGLSTGGTSMTIYGINFLGASSVTFGGTAATIVSVTSTGITVTSPAHAAGAVNVVVTTPGGSSTDVATFTYEGPPAPGVDVLLPNTGLTTGGTIVTLSGINFLGTSSVTFGGTAATLGSVTSTGITVTSPAHAAGAVNVVVTTPGGSSTDVATFTYEAPVSALESWRSAWYGPGATNTGNAADSADPYHTGIPNILVFAFLGPNQNPATAQISQLPQVTRSGGFLTYQFTEPAGVSGITYGAEWSATLGATANWQPVTDTGTAPEHIFSTPISGDRKFLRLTVSPTP